MREGDDDMCTAIWHDGCFGRTLDLDRRYHESVTVTPRRFPLAFSDGTVLQEHYALIGMATVAGGYPLYYEAMNEHGLCMAGLRFQGYAVYAPAAGGGTASFELIPRVLATAADLSEARALLQDLTVTDRAFSDGYPPSPLHWLVADRSGTLAVEPLVEGLRVWENPARVLTNAPPLPQQEARLAALHALSPAAKNGLGGGAAGLPGDWSSASRFVRAAFALRHALPAETDAARVAAAFRLLGTVAVPHGCVLTEEGCCHATVYTCCCDTAQKAYHYTTAADPSVHTVWLNDTDGDTLTVHVM